MNSLPRPGPALAAATVPPCSSTSRFTSVSPRPRPPRARSIACGPCTNTSNAWGSRSGAKPLPVSRTRSTARSPARSTRTLMRPPAGVYLSALSTRFAITCSMRAGSAWIGTPAPCTVTSCSCVRPAWARPSTERRASSPRSCRPSRRSIFPDDTRATSSRSSTRRVRCAVWRRTMSTTRRALSSGVTRSRTATALVRVPSGFLSSWPSMARNSSLARVSASASARRASPSASTCFRSVMSSDTLSTAVSPR